MLWNNNASRAEMLGRGLWHSSRKTTKHQKAQQLHLARGVMNSHSRKVWERALRWYLKTRLNHECRTPTLTIQRWFRHQSTLSIESALLVDPAQAKRLPLLTWRNIWRQRDLRCFSYPKLPQWWWKVAASSKRTKWLWWTKYASRSRSWSHKCV